MPIKRILFYGGLAKEEYNETKIDIEAINRQIISIESVLVAIFMLILFILSFTDILFYRARYIYMIGVVISSTIAICNHIFSKRYRVTTHIITQLSVALYIIYGIYISAVIYNEFPGVTFVAMLIFMSVIFVDRPMNINFFTLIGTIIYNIVAYRTKSSDIFKVDLVNTIIFWWLSFTWSTLSLSFRIKGLYNKKRLMNIAEVDTLTNLKNRNCYEQKIKRYGTIYKGSICCIYIDVNGLHQLNNSAGHDAGDEMLKYVAERIRRYFGYDDTFRIGGDEYVIFCFDEFEDTVINNIIQLNNDVKREGYSISIGYEYTSHSNSTIKDIVKLAERRMFVDKENYYKRNNIVR